MSENLLQLREQVSQIDQEILKLLNKRLQCVQKIGRVKQQEKLPVRDAQREQQVLLSLQKLATEQNLLLTAEDIRNIYQEVMIAALKLQQKSRELV